MDTTVQFAEDSSLDPLLSIFEDPLGFLAKTNGAMLLTLFFSSMLDGLLLHQMYRYVRRYSSDKMFIKVLVACVLIMEAFRSICGIHYCYYTLITKHGDLLDTLIHVTWSGNLNCMLWACISVLLHIFFIMRVSKIAPRFWLISVFAAAFNIAQITTGLRLGVRGFLMGGQAYLTETWLVGMGFAFSIAVDLLLSGALLTGLYKASGYYRIHSLSELITVYFVNTGIVVLILDVLGLIFAVGTHGNLYWAGLNNVITKAYGTTLLSVLNSRTFTPNKDIEVDVLGTRDHRRTINRARRLMTARRWNLPEVLSEDPDLPPTINISVRTEMEADSVSAHNYDSTGKNDVAL